MWFGGQILITIRWSFVQQLVSLLGVGSSQLLCMQHKCLACQSCPYWIGSWVCTGILLLFGWMQLLKLLLLSSLFSFLWMCCPMRLV